MQRWEYCRVNWKHDGILFCIFGSQEDKQLEVSAWQQLIADLGNEGWELVGIVHSNDWRNMVGYSVPQIFNEFSFYFKRPLLAGPNDPTFFRPAVSLPQQ
jgi:hypothetical protein